MNVDNVPQVGEGTGYGAVDKDQAEQVKKTGCVGCVKNNPYKVVVASLALSIGVALTAFAIFGREKDEPEWKQFVAYQNTFNKAYSTDELQERFQAFKESLVEIARLRDLDLTGSATFGVNQFADLTSQEFSDQYLGLNVDLTAKRGLLTATTDAVLGASPSVTAKNWTADGVVTPVRNQGGCGSCWAFACVGTIESVFIKSDGGFSEADVQDFSLSEQQMVSCDDVNYGCMGGWPVDAFGYVQTQGGLATEDDYPYKGETGSCKNNKLDNLVDGTAPQEIGYGAKCETYYNCDDQDEESLAASLEDKGPHVVCVNASPWQYYTGGVLSAKECNAESGNGRRVLNHAVMLTGFDISDSGNSYWSIKNSWSAGWGDSGYIHLEYGSNTCGVANDALYVTL